MVAPLSPADSRRRPRKSEIIQVVVKFRSVGEREDRRRTPELVRMPIAEFRYLAEIMQLSVQVTQAEVLCLRVRPFRE